jgi:FdhD protein
MRSSQPSSDSPSATGGAGPPVADERGAVEVEVRVWNEGRLETAHDRVAEEVPVALIYNGQPHVVMMCTPGDLEDFALGFSLSEGIVASANEVQDISVTALDRESVAAGFEVALRIPQARQQALESRRRTLPGRSGCGLCGAQTLAEAGRAPRRVPAGLPIGPGALRRALDGLRKLQKLNALTGATHAAAWATPDGLIAALREDVGRHNALDKLIGHLVRSGTGLARGFLLITSRASYEMVLKSATVGIPFVVAISAPTAYAIRVAEEAGLTLIGFARGERQVVYACPGRLLAK